MNCDLLEHIEEVKRLDLKPTDVIVLKVRGFLRERQIEDILRNARRVFSTNKVMVLEDDIDIEVVATETVKG